MPKKNKRIYVIVCFFLVLLFLLNFVLIHFLRYLNNYDSQILLFQRNKSNQNITILTRKDIKNQLYKHNFTNFDYLLNEIAQQTISKYISETDCHILYHEMGEDYVKKYNDLNRLLVKNPSFDKIPFCAAGLIHGGLIGYSKQARNSSFFLNEINKQVNEYANEDSLISLNNMHGIGHALRIYFSDAIKSNEICTQISKREDFREECISGVYMQESLDYSAVDLNIYPRKCSTLSENEKFSCYISSMSVKEKRENVYDLAKSYYNICPSENKVSNMVTCVDGMILQLILRGDLKMADISKICSGLNGNLSQYCRARFALTARTNNEDKVNICLSDNNIWNFIYCRNIFFNMSEKKINMYIYQGEEYYEALMEMDAGNYLRRDFPQVFQIFS